MLWWVVAAAVALGMLYYRWSRRRLHQIHAELPCSAKSCPVIGHLYLLKTSDAEQQVWFKTLGRLAIEHGGLTSVWIVNKLYIIVADPESSEVVLKTNMEKGFVTQFIRSVTGNGSIFAPVEIWRPRRKVLAPVFSLRNLHQFVRTFAAQSALMADLMRARAGAGDFSVWPYFTTYTFDSVCETTLGIELNSQRNPNHSFLVAFDHVSKEVARRMVTPWLYPDAVYRRLRRGREFRRHVAVIEDFVDEIIGNKRRELAAIQQGHKSDSGAGVKSFLDMTIEGSARAGRQYSARELREEVTVMVLAGTDTSAVAAAYAAVMLSRHPAAQAQLHAELDAVFGASRRAVTAEDLPRLKYLEAVIKETLRLYPPVPVTAREITNELTLPCGTRLVPGVSVVLDIWATHRNPACWGAAADTFRPERFLRGPLPHPAMFQPFSLSMRNCLGYNYAMMSMKTMLATLLRRYRLLPRAGLAAADLEKPLRVAFDVMMRDMDNYVVRLEER